MAKKTYPALELKNYYLNTLVELLNIPLPAQVARARNRIIKIIGVPTTEFEAARMELIKEYGEKNAAGELIILPNGNYKLLDDKKFDEEWQKLRTEKVVFDVLPSNMADFHVVKDVILNLATELTVEQTAIYEDICEAFEKLK